MKSKGLSEAKTARAESLWPLTVLNGTGKDPKKAEKKRRKFST